MFSDDEASDFHVTGDVAVLSKTLRYEDMRKAAGVAPNFPDVGISTHWFLTPSCTHFVDEEKSTPLTGIY
jgi:hypothetical protein